MSGDDGLREAIARWLHEQYGARTHPRSQRVAAVLAQPEVAELRAKAAAADRVKDCLDRMDPVEVALGGLMYVRSEVDRALDGGPS